MKAVICGAGIAGLSAAKFLSDKGWDIEIVEKAPGLRTAGYILDFFGTGFDAAERAGLLSALRERALDVSALVYVDQNDKVKSKLDYADFVRSLDGRMMSLARGSIERVLYQALPEKLTLRYGRTIAKIDNRPDGVNVTLDDGTALSADLLVGADGIHSSVREQVFGPEERYLRFLGYHTAAFVIEDSRLGAAVGRQFRMLSVPGRQIGLYDAGQVGLTAFFAHAAESPSRPDDPAAELDRVYGDLGWHVPELMAAAGRTDDIYYDLVAQIEMDGWVSNRTVLVGDAAHAVSLLAGQGASLAMGGAWLLAEMLDNGEPKVALSQFEARMHAVVRSMQAAGRRTADWFVPPTVFHDSIRNGFLNLSRMPGLGFLMARFFAPSAKSLIRHR